MEAGLDTGPVLLRDTCPIGAEDTAADLNDRLSAMGARLVVEALGRIGTLAPDPQSEDGVTYAEKIDKTEARIDWTCPAAQVDRQIRALSPFPGAWCLADGARLKLLRSRAVAGDGAPGQVLDGFTIACGDGAVEILEAQREGRRPMVAADVLRGAPLPERLT
jgi:methionyl-tRNA formyltransferase